LRWELSAKLNAGEEVVLKIVQVRVKGDTLT